MRILRLVNNLIDRMRGIPKWLPLLFAVLAFIGFLDASYLTIQHYKGVPPPCSLLEGCEIVTTSKYAEVLGIPVALPGVLYYLSILILTVSFFSSKDGSIFGGGNKRFLAWAALLTPFGFIASLWFLFIQFFVIDALCLYCLVSASTSTALFILGLIIMRRTKSVV